MLGRASRHKASRATGKTDSSSPVSRSASSPVTKSDWGDFLAEQRRKWEEAEARNRKAYEDSLAASRRARDAFEAGNDTVGWFHIFCSAFNAAAFANVVI